MDRKFTLKVGFYKNNSLRFVTKTRLRFGGL